MVKMGSNASTSKKPGSPPKKLFSLFSHPQAQPLPKRRKTANLSSEEDKPKKAPQIRKVNGNMTTFAGNSFTSAINKNADKLDSRRVFLESDSDGQDSEPDWLSKDKGIRIHGAKALSKKKVKLPPPPKTNFHVNRRAFLSSSDAYSGSSSKDEEEDEDSFKTNKVKKTLKGKKNGLAQKAAPKAMKIVSDEEDDDDEDGSEETEETPSSSSTEEDSSERDNKKKSLKDVVQKAKKKSAREKRRKRRESSDAVKFLGDSDNEQEEGSDDEDEREVSFDSSDSDGKQRKTTRSLKKLKEIEEKCIQFINSATEEELKKTEKFNGRLLKFIVEKRPFETFNSLHSMISNLPRGTAQLDQYLEYLENRGILDQVLDDCKQHTTQIKEELAKMNPDNLPPQPSLLKAGCTLHPYQQVGLQWLIMMNKLGLNAILGDEMGLGKTIQIIAFLAWAKEQPRIRGPHLIIVPSSTLENWMNEMQKWCPSLKVLTYYGSIDERAQLRQGASAKNVDCIITTYNMVISRPEDRNFFKRFSINYVIYDEGHMLRSCNTLRYRNLMRIQGQRKILLTGTPLQNNLVELISLLFFTMTKMFTKYCNDISMLLQMFARKGKMLDNKKATKYGRRSKSKKEMDEAVEEAAVEDDGPMYERHKISQAKSILQPFILRRLKTQVLHALPAKHEQITICAITESQDELYSYVLDELREEKESGHSTNYVSLLMQMRQTANHPLLYRRNFDDFKLREMAKLLCIKERQYKEKNPEHVAEDLSFQTDIMINSLCKKFRSMHPFELDRELSLDSGKCKQLDILLPAIISKGEKVLIFSQFTTLLDILELYMECRNYKFCRLDGSTPVLERQELINLFNQDETIPVFLLSTKAGGLGINLTAANHIIIHDIDMNPYNDKQAEDRCHRMGQTKEVYVTRLISRNTIEESILQLAQKKLELEKDVTSSSQSNPNEEQRLDSNIVDKLLTQALAKRKP